MASLPLSADRTATKPARGSPADRRVRCVAMVIQRFRPHFTGQGVQLEQLCQHLAGRGITSHIFTAQRGQPSEHERCDGYTIHRLRCDLLPGSHNKNQLWMPTFAARVGAALLRPGAGFDLVHVHALSDALYPAWLAARLRRIPVLFEMTLLGDDDPLAVARRLHRLRRQRLAIYRRCDGYVAMSRAFLDSYSSAGLPASRLHLIPQGVDTRKFRPARRGETSALRAALSLPVNGPLVAFVGSLIKRKGIDLLLRAWATVHERHPAATLVLIGRDDFEPDSDDDVFLRQAVSSLPAGVAASIVQLGLRDDTADLLRCADVFAFPTRREGFGSVIIEAMACGLPCVVTRLEGITDMIFAAPLTSGTCPGQADGVVVAQEDAGAIAAQIDHLLASPQARSKIGDAARARAVAEYDFTRITDQYLDVYEQLARPAGPRT